MAMDAAPGELSPPPPELEMVARAVQRLVARNDAVVAVSGGGGGGDAGMAAFEAAMGAPVPRIGVAQYLERVHRYAGLEGACYVVAYAYVDRAAHRRPAAAVASKNVHRLLLACLLVSSKVLDDFHHNNAFFARVGGVSNAEMNKLELELLAVLDFEVMVSHRVYELYHAHLEKEMQRGDGSLLADTAKGETAASKLDCSAYGDNDDGRRLPNGAHSWSQGTANSVRRHSSSPSRYSFSC